MIRHTFYATCACLLFSCSGKPTAPGQAPAGPVPEVEVITLEQTGVARMLSAPGTILPGEEISVYSEISGRIRSIHFKEGQLVPKGALLLRMDTDVLQAQKQQQLVELDQAKKDEARKKALLSAKGISLEEYEKAASALEAIEAQIQLLNVQIDKALIRAPFSGRIGLRHVSEGAFITSSTLITTLVQENPVKIEFQVSERYAGSVKAGQQIRFKPENSRDTFQAQVYAYEPVIDAGTRMLTVRATMYHNGQLVPGSYVSVSYEPGTEVQAFMVPAESIIPVLKGQKVLVVRNGKVAEVPVETGIRTPEKVQIMGQLHAGDKVLISGLLAVREGMPVTIKNTRK